MLSEAKHPYGLGFSRGTGCFGGPQHDRSLVKLRIAVEVKDALIDMAMSLAEKHALRGYDSVQLAAALSLQQVRASLSLPTMIFVSADNRLNASAQAESLPVENPNEKD
jgi:hypothetical protein